MDLQNSDLWYVRASQGDVDRLHRIGSRQADGTPVGSGWTAVLQLEPDGAIRPLDDARGLEDEIPALQVIRNLLLDFRPAGGRIYLRGPHVYIRSCGERLYVATLAEP